MLAFCKISTEVKLSCHFNYFLEVVTPFFEYPELCSYSSALYKIMTLKKKKNLLWPFLSLARSARLITGVFAFL